MLESIGTNRLSYEGNELPTTPNIDKLIRKGYYFSRFYVPDRSTSKIGLYSLFLVCLIFRASRPPRVTPLLAPQKSIVSELKGYDKHYFIGGNLSWQIFAVSSQSTSLICNSSRGISLAKPMVDGWGISDEDLFWEVQNRLDNTSSDKPFFVYVQTAGNHRPFTIPKDTAFKVDNRSTEALKANGLKTKTISMGCNFWIIASGDLSSGLSNRNITTTQ